MRALVILLAVVSVSLALPGCGRNPRRDDRVPGELLGNLPFVHRMPVQQGNVIDESMLDQVELGMTRNQVLFVLGTPMLTDMFHTDRWDYTYTIRRGREPMQVKPLTLWFEDDALVRIDGYAQPNRARAEAAQEGRELVVEVPDWEDNRGIINRALNVISRGN
ncbi:MAG: outer membrane protein assembly factor BamE [Chromatiaceae bacterium]|nr:MAG: outer membrane protein assembly factor BamE [Chromatiaceae bacterium]